MNKTEQLVDESNQIDGVVFYTDGGSRPNGKYMGWGVHGYAYSDKEPKKGSGNPTHYPSAFGYVDKIAKKEKNITEVTPIKYFDGYGCSSEFGTNNLAEVLAVKLATDKALDNIPKKLLIRTDSEYVIKGSLEWSNKWISSGWKRQDGSDIPNTKYWIELLKNYETLRSNNCDVKIEWVKGHSDILGNNLSDRLATVGVMGSVNGESRQQFDISEPDGYWKSTVDKNPFFSLKMLFFVTSNFTKDYNEYLMGDLGKLEEMFGKRIPDGCYSVIHLKKPEPIIDLVRQYQTQLSGYFENVVIARLDHIFRNHVYNSIERYGVNALVRKFQDKIDLYGLDKEPITKELNPPRLAQRCIDALSSLKDILINFKQSNYNEKFKAVDITNVLFTKKTIVKKKDSLTMFSLNSNVDSKFTCFIVDITEDGKTYKLILSLGIDLPTRNSLKSMESSDIEVKLLYWRDSEKVIRYCVGIRSIEDYGVWSSYYSNMLFLN